MNDIEEGIGNDFGALDPSTLTYEEAAEHIVRTLRDLQRFVHGFNVANAGRRKKISTAASWSDEALGVISTAIQSSEVVAGASKLAPEEIEDALRYSRAYREAFYESQIFSRGIDDSIAEKRAGVGRRAAVAYKVARSLDLPGATEAAVPNLPQMRQLSTRGRRKTGDARVVAQVVKVVKRTTRRKPVHITVTRETETSPVIEVKVPTKRS
jgi:hypothetical protein